MFIDTHCHIHESGFYPDDREAVYQRAVEANVKMICIGTSEKFFAEAVEFAAAHQNTWATVGVHPHDTKDGWMKIGELLRVEHGRVARGGVAPAFADKIGNDGSGKSKIVGIGEIGLDYFYDNSPRQTQIAALEQQLQWASDYGLPVSFHVRESFDDFWPIFANFPGVKGVLHSFTDSTKNLEKALANNLFIGVNGISTFSKTNQGMWDQIPLEKMLLETDAPFLTPTPFRGKINEPMYVREVAAYHARKRGISLDKIAATTSRNAAQLFHIITG